MLISALTAGARSEAWPLSATAGVDYFTDSSDQRTVAALAIAALGLGRGDVLLSGMRFDNNVVGSGSGVIAGGGIPLGSEVTLRGLATRLIGDGDYRAWRIKAGPMFQLAAQRSLALYYTHDESTVSPRADGVLAEVASPIVPTVVGRATAGYAFTGDGAQGAQAAAGLGWTPIPHLELSGQVGIARSVIANSGEVPGPRRNLLPILNGGGQRGSDTSTDESPALTALVGVRVPFP